MSQSPITITYSLKEVLREIKQSLDTIKKDVTDSKVELTALKTNVENVDKRLEKVESTKKKQVLTLITLLGGSLVTIAFRVFLSSTNI